MKPTVYLFQPLGDGAKWQQALQRLGIEPKQICDPEEILSLCRSGMTGILFADRMLFSAALDTSGANAALWTNQGGGIVLTGAHDPTTSFSFPVEELGECRDPLIINNVLLRLLPDYSRRLPRIDTKLPGIYMTGKQNTLCEILSIGPGGAFIKTGTALPETGTIVQLIIALLGMRKEIEVEASVVRHVIPNEYNQYQHGFGVCFNTAAPSLLADLCEYIKNMVCVVDAPLSYSPTFSPHHNMNNTAPHAAPGVNKAGTHRGREKSLTRIR